MIVRAFQNFPIRIYYLATMKILIVKLSSIGDIVHTLPALAAIRRALPEAEISWAVEKSAAEILEAIRLIENLIEIDTRSLRESATSSANVLDGARTIARTCALRNLT